MIAQQFVFGYREGHRRLAGSAELDKAAAATLLGVTDASVGPRTRRLITALPLRSVGLYALCGTWPAPEAGRPGAVWAHALLVPLDQLGNLDGLIVLATALRRPSPDTIGDFTRPLKLVAGSSSRQEANLPLIAQLLASSMAEEAIPVVATRDLDGGEASLSALWDGAWPELRATLSFRTRERVRATPNLGYLCVARRVTGMWRPHAAASTSHAATLANSRWVYDLADLPRGLEPSHFRRFLRSFGPEGTPCLTRLVELGELHDLVRRNEALEVARELSLRHPRTTDSPVLKNSLFGRFHKEWWTAAELDVVMAVLKVGGRGFNAKSLKLASRVRELVASGNVVHLAQACQHGNARRYRSMLLEALVEAADPSLLHDVTATDLGFGTELAKARPDLLELKATWSLVSDDQAVALASAVELSDRAIAAAVLACRFSAVEPVVSLPVAALRLARARQVSALKQLFDQRDHAEALAHGDGDVLRIELAAVGVEPGSVPLLLDALEVRRQRVDEAWLRAAVYSLRHAGRPLQGTALEVVFGPLHHAITDDRLPRELWKDLGKITPAATDPALRLRRLLVTVARAESWSSETLQRALRGSGPYVKELRAEIDGDDDDPFVAVVKVAMKALKRIIG